MMIIQINDSALLGLNPVIQTAKPTADNVRREALYFINSLGVYFFALSDYYEYSTIN